MNLNDFLTLVTQLLYVLVAGLTLLEWVRHREQTHLDIALAFVSLAVTIVAQNVQQVAGLQLPWLSLLGSLAILAQPYLLLRVAHDFRPVRPLIRHGALLGLGLSWLTLASVSAFNLSPLPAWAALFVIVYFVSVEAYATFVFVRGALTTAGITRWRLRLASAGSGLLAALILLIPLAVVVPAPVQLLIAPLFQVLAALSGLSYYLGFATPRWLKRVWQLSELYRFLHETATEAVPERSAMFEKLCLAAVRAVGGLTAVVARWEPAQQHLRLDLPGEPLLATLSLEADTGAFGQAWHTQQARVARVPQDLGTEATPWAKRIGARALLIVPLMSPSRAWGLLIVALGHWPLFAQDDLDVLHLLARETLRTAELQAALAKTETLYTITRAAVASENLLEALQQVTDRMAAILPANRVSLIVFDQTAGRVIHFIRGGPSFEKLIATVSFDELMEGLTGWVVREGRSALSAKGAPDPRESEAVQQRRIATRCGSVAVAPLRYLDQILGTLTAINLPEERDFSDEDIQLMEAIASQAAIIVVRANLVESLQQVNQLLKAGTDKLTQVNNELTNSNASLQAEIAERKLLEVQIRQNATRAQALAELSQILAEASLEEPSPFLTIAQRISELIGDTCSVTLLSTDGQWLETMATYHPNPEGIAFIRTLLASTHYSVNEGLAGQVARTGQSLLMPTVSPETLRAQMKPELRPYLDRFGVASLLIVPMRARNHIQGTIGVTRDKPDHPYTAEDQVFLQNLADRAGLAIENTRLFTEAKQARATADRANLAKSEFLSRMSHELRTPLNAVLGFGQILEIEDPNERQLGSVRQILHAGKHLLQLINEVLDISRIETGNLSISSEPILVSEAVPETLDLVQSLAAQRRIQLLASSLPQQYIQADRQRLKQVLLNLLTNAVKYNHPGGRVIIDCEVASTQRLRIRVSDTGPGIPSDKMARLFVPFDRLGAEASDVEGLGIGLALSQRLVEVMGGVLGVESTVGQGSMFWVELPIVEGPVERVNRTGPLPVAIEPTSGKTRTVLYIEDNLSNLKLIEQILSYRPTIRLLTTTSGKVSLDMARDRSPDLILLDLNLPDLPGPDVLLALQADLRTRDTPVIVVSADATPRQIERLIAAGARAYLTKPLDVQQFLKVVDELLKPVP